MKSLLSILLFITVISGITSCESDNKEKYLLQYNMPVGETMRINSSTDVDVQTMAGFNKEKYTSNTFTNYSFKVKSKNKNGDLEMSTNILNYSIFLKEGGEITSYNSLKSPEEMDAVDQIMHQGIEPYLNKEIIFTLSKNGEIINELKLDGKPIPKNDIMDPWMIFPEFPKKPIAVGHHWTTTNTTPSTNVKRKFSYSLHEVDSLYYYIKITKMSAPKLHSMDDLKTSGLVMLNRKDGSLAKTSYKLSINKPKEINLTVEGKHEVLSVPADDNTAEH